MGVSNTAVASKDSSLKRSAQQVQWGRTSNARWDHNIGALFLITAPVVLVHLNYIALEYHDGSLTNTIASMGKQGFVQFARQYFPQPSIAGFLGYSGWIITQALLFRFLPGPLCFGQRTPGGHLLSYTANGVMAWAITHLLYLGASVLGIIDPAIITKSWAGLFVAANTYGFVIAILAQLKVYAASSYPEDDKFTGESLRAGFQIEQLWLTARRLLVV